LILPAVKQRRIQDGECRSNIAWVQQFQRPDDWSDEYIYSSWSRLDKM